MPTWGQILVEINASTKQTANGSPNFDQVRRKYLKALSNLTGRATIIYSTAWLEAKPLFPQTVQVHLSDIQGFMETMSNIKEKELDLILHSPGGNADAAQSIVEFMRKRFDHIRVFVPIAAMSAATMIALSCDEIVMGHHSQLGPTDPQFIIDTPEGPRSAPAQAILDQFTRSKEECRKDPAMLAAWMPIIRTYAPGLLLQCEKSQEQAIAMVAGWLKRFMFASSSNAEDDAQRIAEWFAKYDNFGSHGERVGREKVRELGVQIIDLEDDDKLQDAVLSVHHATVHTFSRTPATKIIENHHGRSFVYMSGTSVVPPSGSVLQQLKPKSNIARKENPEKRKQV